MAQRRSRNRRSSRKSNVSGFLDDNTNIFDKDDTWGYASIIRPSMPIEVTKNASSILNADSTVDATAITENWQNNLTRSDSSKLMEDVIRKNVSSNNINAQNENRSMDPATESESDTEFLKKRAGYGLSKKQINKTEKSNIFLKAMEKTTEHTKTYTSDHITSENDSELINDESRTIKRLRPRVLKNNKQKNESDINHFDNILGEDTPTSIQNSTRSSRSSLKRKSDGSRQNDIIQKFRKSSQKEKIVESLVGKSATQETIIDTPTRELRQRTIPLTPLSQKLSQNQSVNISKENVADESLAKNLSATATGKRKRPALFSQGNKSRNEENAFDDALASGTDNQSEEEVVSKVNKENNASGNISDSESSTIPPNIRRTRSHSMFLGRKSNNVSKNISISKSINKSAINVSTEFNSSKSKNKSVSKSKSNISERLNESKKLDDDNRSTSESEIYGGSKSRISEEVSLSSEDENIFEGSDARKYNSQNKQEETQNKSQNQTRKLKSTSQSSTNISSEKQLQVSATAQPSQDMSTRSQNKSQDEEGEFKNKSVTKEANKSHRSSRSKNISRNSVEDEVPSSLEISRKTRSQLLQKKTFSNSKNAFDQISYTEDSPRRQRTRLNLTVQSSANLSKLSKTSKNQSKELSIEANTKNATEVDEYEGDSSSIPKYVRRTRLFQKSKSFIGEDVESEMQNNKNLENVQSPKSQHSKSNRSFNRNASTLRDTVNVLEQPKVVLHRMSEKDISLEVSSESLKENQETSPQKSKNAITSLKSKISNDFSKTSSKSNLKNNSSNKTKVTTDNSEVNENGERSVSTSLDGTPVNTRNKNQSDVVTPAQSIISDNFSDDLLHTPHPAQSTLIASGKPVSRITQFFYRSMKDGNLVTDTPSPTHVTIAESIHKQQEITREKQIQKSFSDENQVTEQRSRSDEDINVDESDDEQVSDYPLLTRQLNDIPYEAEKTTFEDNEDDDHTPFLSNRPSKALNRQSDNISTIEEAQFEEAKRKTDAFKKIMESQLKREREAREADLRKKAMWDAKFKRTIAQNEAEKKKKLKKVDKAYYVNGQIYKQPKLPRPKNWTTDRLYKHLWKCMEPLFGLKTRIESEKFVVKLSEVVSLITRRKKYENYKSDLDELLYTMAKLKIIKTRYDFHRFCSDFMPYSFRIKVVPMMLPGNVKNIPFEPELLNVPILQNRILRQRPVNKSASKNKSVKNKNKNNSRSRNSRSRSRSKSRSRSRSKSRSRSRSRSKSRSRSRSRSRNKSRSRSRSKSRSRSRSKSRSRSRSKSRSRSRSRSKSRSRSRSRSTSTSRNSSSKSSESDESSED